MSLPSSVPAKARLSALLFAASRSLRRAPQDFHEARFRTFVMRIVPLPVTLAHTAGKPVGGACRWRRSHPETRQETIMKWETPAASDMRFGFEITMYIANR